MRYTEEEKKEIAGEISLVLNSMPEVDDLNYKTYDRLSINNKILQDILFDKNNNLNFNIGDLRKLDLSGIDFSNKNIENKDFSYTNVRINPQRLEKSDDFGPSLFGTNLEGVDMGGVSFDGVCIIKANLKGTGAYINPQNLEFVNGKYDDSNEIYVKCSLYGTNLEGLDLSDACFDYVDIRNANFKGTNAHLDFKHNYGYDSNTECFRRTIYGLNAEGLHLSQASFDGLDVRYANLKGTGASIDPQNVALDENGVPSLTGLNAEGLIFDNRSFAHTDISFANFEGCDLSTCDMVMKKRGIMNGVNLNYTRAKLDYNEVLYCMDRPQIRGCMFLLSSIPIYSDIRDIIVSKQIDSLGIKVYDDTNDNRKILRHQKSKKRANNII